MSATMYRRQLEQKRQQRLAAEQKSNEFRSKESKKRTDAAKARQAASTTKSAGTQKSKLREADRNEKEATTAGGHAASWAKKASRYGTEEAALQTKLVRAERAEALDAEKKRNRDEQQAARQAKSAQQRLESRVARTEEEPTVVARQLPQPKAEKLRVLILGASADGGLRLGREQKRIRAAVESALGRDLIEFDVRPAATTDDLQDGISRFRPHVVHFSGHSGETVIEFEDDTDESHAGVVVTAAAFARAVAATDAPPLLVFLNSCESAGHIQDLVENVAPFAIGMSDEIGDTDAIVYAARFYTSIADGQSVLSAHAAGQAALDLAGLESAELPTLAWADDVNPGETVLVTLP